MIPQALLAALGFFALFAQTLLFRDYLTAFEGNELAVGGFFVSWFVWIAAGAWAARKAVSVHRVFPPLVLLYLPAFAAEHVLILSARTLSGVATYEVFPFGPMLALAMLTNAPLSFATGFFFTLACGWLGQMRRQHLPVARVYVLETLGAAAGGLAVTLLFSRGLAAMTIFLAGALVLSLGVSAATRNRWTRFVPPVLLLAAFGLGFGDAWTRHDAQRTWARALPVEAYQGRFYTPQGEYLYGESAGQFVVLASGRVSEALPGAEHGAEVAALTLAQNPTAARVLVAGPGALPICLQFARLPQIESVVWLHPDSDFPAQIARVLPGSLQQKTQTVSFPAKEIRAYLQDCTEPFDLILLNMPDPTSLVLNRYFTQSFFVLAKDALSDRGVAALRVTGAANFLGGELALLGGSACATFASVFPYTAMKPGNETWLFGSNADILSESPATVRDRFAAIPGAAEVYPPEALMPLFPPDRIAFQRDRYRQMQAADDASLLINTDARPRALLFSLLVTLRQAGVRGMAAHLPVWTLVIKGACLGAMGLYALLRMVYRGRNGRGAAIPPFDAGAILFSAGFVGIASSVMLMFGYQSRFGSLFLYVGVLSTLFMAGAAAGSRLVETWLRRHPEPSRALLIALVSLHAFLLLSMALDMTTWPLWRYVAMFAACGGFTGAYFPWCARRFQSAGRDPATTGAILESVDHLGAAAGALGAGLLILPVFGSSVCAGLLALLLAACLLPALMRGATAPGGDWLDRRVRALGYTLFGLGALLLLASQLAAWAGRGESLQRLADLAPALANGKSLELKEARLADGSAFPYFAVSEIDKVPEAYIFHTAPLSNIPGYGGPIDLAVVMDPEGNLREVRVLESRETPSYLALVSGWMEMFKGQNVLRPGAFAAIDGVSGATITSNAILRTVQTASGRFAADVLGKTAPETPAPPPRQGPDKEFWWLLIFLAAALFLRIRPRPWPRRLLLLASVSVLGIWLNLQYSTQHVFTLLGGGLVTGWTAAFLLVGALPVFAVLFGNVYCGYVCPFGALQELVGELRPARWNTDPPKEIWRYARWVKYLLLFLVVALYAITRDYAVLSADPLTTVFSPASDRRMLFAAAGLLVLSIPYRRFWCRNLCPAGAFLALLGSLRLLRFIGPKAAPSRCDLGVRHSRELDCIRCDRCLHAKK
jgi:spermidine synthase